MPPKKKKGKDSAAGKKEKKAEERPQVEPITEESKEFYQLQIRDLEVRLERYQNKWDEICAKENQFQAQFEQLSSDKKEIVSFLKRALNQRMDEIADLNDQLTGLHQAKDSEKEAYEAQLAQVRSESQENKDRLTSENMLLAGKLASLEEFRVQKEELMAKFAALEEKLRAQEEEHKEMMYSLEKKAVLDKDRLKKEMVQRVNTVAAEFRRVSNNQMAETTKRAIRENVAIGSQLAKMSDKSMELINENDLLKERESELHKKLAVLEENERELVKKSLSNQKVIRMLTEKCQQQQEMLDVAEQKEHELHELHTEHWTLQEEAQILRQRMVHLEEEMQRLMSEKNEMIGQLEDEKKKKQSVETVLSEASLSLKDVLMETPRIEEEDTEVTLLVKRNQLLEKLLVLLNSAATLGIGPALDDFQSRDNQSMDHHITPIANRHFVSPNLKGPGVVPHYRIGDLGLVPRQDTSGAVISKIGMLSKTTRLGPIQANPGVVKDLLSISQEARIPRQSALPGIPSTSGNKSILMA
ncbi:cilia- and flagella-associated protein 157 [Mantella aurantiaca]